VLLIALATLAAPARAQAEPSHARAQALAPANDDDVRAVTDTILGGPEFREFAERDTRSLRDWLQKLLRWLRDLEDDPEPEPARKPLALPPLSAEVLMVMSLIALCLIAVYVTSRRNAVVPPPARGSAPQQELALIEREPLSFLDEAAELAAQGQARAALRALYLATLVSLDRAALIELEPSRTNWQYIRSMPRGEARKLFSAFTRIFDHKWYGHEPATLDDYQRCRMLADRLYAEASARNALPARGAKVMLP
jgi:hypothetical protein